MNKRITRRTAMKMTAAASALPLVHISTAGAAGRLSLAFWDHWVPAGNVAMNKIVDAWAKKNKVEVQLDFLTSIGNKITIMMAAEAQAQDGHDVFAFDQWSVQQYYDRLDPVDDLVNKLSAKYGKMAHAFEYLAKVKGHWMALPVPWGSASLPPCARISLLKKHAGIDVRKWYPNHPSTPEAAKDWTYDTQLRLAEDLFKAGYPMGFGCNSGLTDANQVWGATFGAFGADLVDGKGNITLDTPEVEAVLEYARKMIRFMPPDAPSWDDTSNNRALISGKAAMIWNPPSAWAVAKRDAPHIAEDCWTFPAPRGVKGRLVPHRPYFWGIWQFARNKGAARELMEFLAEREQVEALSKKVAGYDIPPFGSMTDFKVWEEVEPPKGTVYNYPIRPWHDAQYYIAGSSAPPDIAVQMWNRSTQPGMVARLMSGQSIKKVKAWAKDELQGFMR